MSILPHHVNLLRIIIGAVVFIVYVSTGSTMVRNYRGPYDAETVQKAINSAVNDGFSVKKASSVFGVPRTRLIRRLKYKSWQIFTCVHCKI